MTYALPSGRSAVASDDRQAPLSASFAAATDQAAGLLVLPVVLVALGSVLTTDLEQLGWLITLPAVAWIVVYRIASIALRFTSRHLPWAIGGVIVRSASLALLAYVVASNDSGAQQQLESVLICMTTYGAATGLTRAATRTYSLTPTAGGRWVFLPVALRIAPTVLLAALGIAAGSFLAGSDRAALDRFATIFTVAAVVSVSTIVLLSRLPQSPRRTGVPRPLARLDLRVGRGGWAPLLWLLTSSVMGAAELFALLRIDLIRGITRGMMLSGVGAYLLTTGIFMAMWTAGLAGRRPATLASLGALCGGSALAFSLALPTLLGAGDAPETLLGRPAGQVAIWITMALIAASQLIRRSTLADVAGRVGISPGPVALAGLLAAFMPVVAGRIVMQSSIDRLMIVGLVAAIISLVIAGLMPLKGRTNPRAAAPGTTPFLATAQTRGHGAPGD